MGRGESQAALAAAPVSRLSTGGSAVLNPATLARLDLCTLNPLGASPTPTRGSGGGSPSSVLASLLLAAAPGGESGPLANSTSSNGALTARGAAATQSPLMSGVLGNATEIAQLTAQLSATLTNLSLVLGEAP